MTTTQQVKITKVFAGFYTANNGFHITNVYGGWYADCGIKYRERFNTFKDAKAFVIAKGFPKVGA